MKKIILPAIVIAAIVVITTIMALNDEGTNLHIIKDESYYSDFSVEDNRVYIKCDLKIQNSSSEDKVFILDAIMKEDVVLGLLKNKNLQGFDDQLIDRNFIIKKNSSSRFYVIFVGEFAGTNKKHDRNLPEIIITEVQD